MSSRFPALALLVATSFPLFAADRSTGWREDLTVLAAELKRVHPRFRDCGLTPDFEARRAALSARIGGLSDEQAVVEIQRLLASVGDGHTLLWPFGMKKGTLLRLPVMLWSFEEGLYVIDAADRGLIGKRIVRIGGIEAAAVLGRLETVREPRQFRASPLGRPVLMRR